MTRSFSGGVLRRAMPTPEDRFLRFSCFSRSVRIFFAIAESDCFGFLLAAVDLVARVGLVVIFAFFRVAPDLALAFCFATFKRALTNSSFRMECQPATPFSLAIWASSLDF